MADANWIGNSTINRSLTLSGAFSAFIYGLTLRTGGSLSDSIALNTDGGVRVYRECTLWCGNTSSTARIRLGTVSNISANAYTRLQGCIFRFANASQGINIGGGSIVEMYSCSFHASSTALTNAIGSSDGGLVSLIADSCDFTNAGSTTTIVSAGDTGGLRTMRFSNCKIGSSASWFASQTPANQASSELWVFNCAAGDTHYNFGYYNALGSVVSGTAIVATGAKFDGTNAVSWQVTTTSAVSEYMPFITPWIEVYHSGTSAITPSLEICRSGSTTAYKDNEVWGQFGYQGTSGSPLGIIVEDRAAITSAGASQTTGALGASDWTGESGTSWFGKLNPTSTITPAEIGTLRARVFFSVPSKSDLYIDPYIWTA